MINDVSRAFSHARAIRDVYAQIPDERKEFGEEQFGGTLNCCMHGTRDAVLNWQIECSQMLVDNGFKQGVSTFHVFYHAEKRIRTLVHGDDYVSIGEPQQLECMEQMSGQKYNIKTQVLGPGKDNFQQFKCLNGRFKWDGNKGIIYEADPRYVEILVEQLGFANAKATTTFGTKDEGCTQEDIDEKMEEREVSQYKAFVARGNHLRPDRPDTSCNVKEFARNMSKPIRSNWAHLRRI